MRMGWLLLGLLALYSILGVEAAIRLGEMPVTIGITVLEFVLLTIFLAGIIRGGWFRHN